MLDSLFFRPFSWPCSSPSAISASLAIERKLTGDGLASLCSGEDMTLMLARALLEGRAIQGAESVWHALNQRRQEPRLEKVIPFVPKTWSLELLEERSDMLREDFLYAG